MRSPSVSTQAASTPSREVPLIIPMVLSMGRPCYAGAGRPGKGGVVLQRRGLQTAMSGGDFLHEARERGFVHQVTDEAALAAKLRAAAPVAGYIGFDCAADSLPVGHLMSIMLLRLFQKAGNRPVVLIGGGTTKVGDPSGKDEARQLLTDEAIEANKAGIRRSFEGFLEFGDGPTGAVM